MTFYEILEWLNVIKSFEERLKKLFCIKVKGKLVEKMFILGYLVY